MSTKSVIKSIIQKGDKSQSAIDAAFDNANEVASRENNEGKKQK